MSIEEHIKNVDWNRVHEKSNGLDKARGELTTILTSFIPFLLLSQLKILEYLGQYEALWGVNSPIPTLKFMVRVFPIVMLPCLVYSGYKYFKWSQYDVMCK